MVAPHTRSYYASNPPTMLAGRFGGGFAGAVQLGGVALAGSLEGPVVPTWASAAAVNQIVTIPGTAGAGGAAVDAFCGWVYRPSAKTIYIAAAGGHNDSFDNRVVALDLRTNSPAWVTLKANTGSNLVLDQAYQPDGTPSSRHTYHYHRWSEQQQRVMLMGCYAPYGPGVFTFNILDGFNPATNTWDAQGTWANTTAGFYANAHDPNGDSWALWGGSSARRWNASSATWSTVTITNVGSAIRFPWAWDSLRNQFYGLAIGDSQGGGTDLRSTRMVGTVQSAITFSAGSTAALVQFQSGDGQYPGMDYDAANDRFVWYDGRGAQAGKIFTITPNGTTVWDMAVLTTTGATLPATNGGGLNNKLTYVDFGTVKGFVLMPNASAGCYFLRTA
jgi:hypothetical protein